MTEVRTPEAAWEQVLDTTPIAVAIVETPTRVVWTNSAFRAAFGRDSFPEGIGILVVMEKDGPDLDRGLAEVLAHRRPLTLSSVRLVGNGKATASLVDIDLRPLPRGTGEPSRLVMTVRDRAEFAREHERAVLFRESFLSSSNAIEVTDRNGILVDVNPAFERIYGFSHSECVGRKSNLVRGRSTPRELYEGMWRSLLDPDRGHWSGELMNRDRMGKERPVFLTITAIRNDAGETTHYLGVAIDLSEQKTWERTAAHADKLASLGQLAAGVAHEINTPLANVMLIAESIRRRSTDPWVRTRVDTISAQVELAGKIVNGLLEFSRRGDPQVTKLDLVEVTRDALAFLRGKQSADVEFTETYPHEVVPIWGDRGQLIQVLTNLFNNACEAMDGAGVVRVELRRVGAEVEVEVSDTGPGISDSVLPHIFEPFFTTKAEGKGTGLGLAICHGIIQAHHGSVTVRNHPKGGASFIITLPVTSSDLAPDP